MNIDLEELEYLHLAGKMIRLHGRRSTAGPHRMRIDRMLQLTANLDSTLCTTMNKKFEARSANDVL
jgi:hypothetical protein